MDDRETDDHETYEIRYLKADGNVALIHVAVCASDGHAHEVALKLFDHSFHSHEIWRGNECIKREGHPLSEQASPSRSVSGCR